MASLILQNGAQNRMSRRTQGRSFNHGQIRITPVFTTALVLSSRRVE